MRKMANNFRKTPYHNDIGSYIAFEAHYLAISGSSSNCGQFNLWTIGSVTHRSGPLTDGSPRPGDTRRHFKASNEIADDVMNY